MPFVKLKYKIFVRSITLADDIFYRIWNFMQNVSWGDNLHEMSNSIFLENKLSVVCWIYSQNGKM